MNAYRSFFLAIVPLVAVSGCSKLITQEGTGCMEVELDAECPAAEDVDPDDLSGSCGTDIRKVTGEGTYQDDIGWGWYDSGMQTPGCCYPIVETQPTCVYGRPLLVEGEARLAEIVSDPSWAVQLVPQDAPEALREELVKRWTRAALDEHASVAAFSKVALDLMRLGAPPELLARTHQAAIDEVRHAQLGFALASAFKGEPVGPGRYALEQLPLAEDLVQLATEAALEGCLGETLASLLALEGAQRTRDPVLKQVLQTIAVDEQQHSLLAWSTVKWALDQGGEPVRQALLAVFDRAAREGIAIPEAPAMDLSAWGLLSHEDSVQVAQRCMHEVVLPAARALLQSETTTKPAGRASTEGASA